MGLDDMKTPLFFEVEGKGPSILLLHGLALDHTIWHPVSQLLKHEVKVIMPDLRGHGSSPSPSGEYSMYTMAEDLIHLMDEIDLEKTYLAGHSMGGYIALAFAWSFPERLSGLALVASHIYPDSPEKKQSRLAQIIELEESEPAVVFEEMPFGLTKDKEIVQFCWEIIKKTNPKGMRRVLAGMAERLGTEDINKKLEKPLLIIAGVEDQFIPIETSRQMAEEMKPQWLIEVENAGHMVMMEKPERTAEALRKLIFSNRRILDEG